MIFKAIADAIAFELSEVIHMFKKAIPIFAKNKSEEKNYQLVLRAEAEKIENRLEEIELEMAECATDYKKLSELDDEKNSLEERLLEIYGEI